ncbi:MAG TPA: hypothetical protein VK820_11005 [Steroidobacteraceae bacterium]|jgi:hypothetical protein|nr:hypothetical protein [Steroidobacteraceae bacterium]
MMKPSVIAACVLGSMLWGAHIASADDPKPASKPAHSTAPSTCMHSTGTRIKLPPGECSASAGRSYSSQEIDQTGKTTVGGALRLMDPSMFIH